MFYKTDEIKDITKKVMRMHPKNCIFKSQTPELCAEYLQEFIGTKEEFIDNLALIFESCELYCPHENINRLPTL